MPPENIVAEAFAETAFVSCPKDAGKQKTHVKCLNRQEESESMWVLSEAIEYYRTQGAPGDQQMLVALLREVMEETGPLTQEALSAIAQAYGLGRAILPALIRRVPSLRMDEHPHRLEICANCGRKLAAWVENTYQVKPGGASDALGFTFHVVGCMKNCKASPSVKWDGVLYPRADERLIEGLLKPKTSKEF